MSKFKNKHGYIEELKYPFLLCLLLGPIYFAMKRIWSHCTVLILLLSLILITFIPLIIAWLFYPFFAKSIIENSYLRKGWKKISKDEKTIHSKWTN